MHGQVSRIKSTLADFSVIRNQIQDTTTLSKGDSINSSTSALNAPVPIRSRQLRNIERGSISQSVRWKVLSESLPTPIDSLYKIRWNHSELTTSNYVWNEIITIKFAHEADRFTVTQNFSLLWNRILFLTRDSSSFLELGGWATLPISLLR